MSAMIDGYAHLGLPRFWGLSDYRPVMREMNIVGALVCPFDSCPDLAECHRALRDEPEVFRAFGLPIGGTRSEIEAGVLAQLEAGFDGVRIGEQQLLAQPWVLDGLAREGGIAMVVGSRALAAIASSLLKVLDAFPEFAVVAPHFAGPTDPEAILAPGPARSLFSHPRFFVVMSRQGMFPDATIDRWGAALIDVCGWSRLMWGSEAPIPYWRDERVADTPAWITRFTTDADLLGRFYHGVARQAIFARPRRPVGPLRMPVDPWQHVVATPAPMFPFGLSTDTRLPARIVRAWMAEGGEAKGPLSAFVCRLIDRSLAEA